jgi:hypothetical protein
MATWLRPRALFILTEQPAKPGLRTEQMEQVSRDKVRRGFLAGAAAALIQGGGMKRSHFLKHGILPLPRQIILPSHEHPLAEGGRHTGEALPDKYQP